VCNTWNKTHYVARYLINKAINQLFWRACHSQPESSLLVLVGPADFTQNLSSRVTGFWIGVISKIYYAAFIIQHLGFINICILFPFIVTN